METAARRGGNGQRTLLFPEKDSVGSAHRQKGINAAATAYARPTGRRYPTALLQRFLHLLAPSCGQHESLVGWTLLESLDEYLRVDLEESGED